MFGVNSIGIGPTGGGHMPKSHGSEQASSYAKLYTAQAGEKLIASLEQKYGYEISIKSIAKDQKSIERHVMGQGSAKITIAPNILEEMVGNASFLQHIEGKISQMAEIDRTLPQKLALYDREYIASGMIVHEDGSVTYWVMSDDTPEKKAEIQKKMQEEAQAKTEQQDLYESLAIMAQERRIITASSPLALSEKVR